MSWSISYYTEICQKFLFYYDRSVSNCRYCMINDLLNALTRR